LMGGVADILVWIGTKPVSKFVDLLMPYWNPSTPDHFKTAFDPGCVATSAMQNAG